MLSLVRFHRPKMRFWFSYNSTFINISRLGLFDTHCIALRRDLSLFHSVENNYYMTASSCGFIEPNKQVASYHTSTFIAAENKFENNHKKRKGYQRRSNDKANNLPTFLIPGLTSFFLFSSYRKTGLVSEGQNFNISTGIYCLPKTEGSPQKGKECTPIGCGEDSYCIAENDSEVVLAVADGVGGWRKQGVDPAIFSQTLMYHASEIAKSSDERLQSDLHGARTLLKDAFWRLVKDFTTGKKKPFGSSTACVVIINRETGRLKFGNLGDSGFIILTPVDAVEGLGSKYRIKFKSESQQHVFNMPYQITLAPPHGTVKDSTDLAATDALIEPPKELGVEIGDIVLLMTDGVLDNIFDDELEEIVSTSVQLHSRKHSADQVPNLVSQDIAFKARAFSEDTRRESPFTIEARKHKLQYLGGKEDDITVVTAIIYPKNKK